MNRTSTIKLVIKHMVLNTSKKPYNNNNNKNSLVLLYTISIQYYFIIFLGFLGFGNTYKNVSTGAV